jgi:tRNA threonylcarbamoyladenosine biosynthesis protein TsaB
MLAFSSSKPVCGVPTLAALAYSARLEARLICAVIPVGVGDAVYAGLYRPVKNTVEQIGDYYTGDIKGLAERVTGPAVLVGSGATQLVRILGTLTEAKLKAVEALPSGVAVAFLAQERLARDESDDALSLTPLYLKESTAKVFTNKYVEMKA